MATWSTGTSTGQGRSARSGGRASPGYSIYPEGFEVALIPLTLARTTFGDLRPGEAVNVEADIVGKYVLRYLESRGSGISLDFLKKHGFA
jgi:hypothetical protein